MNPPLLFFSGVLLALAVLGIIVACSRANGPDVGVITEWHRQLKAGDWVLAYLPDEVLCHGVIASIADSAERANLILDRDLKDSSGDAEAVTVNVWRLSEPKMPPPHLHPLIIKIARDYTTPEVVLLNARARFCCKAGRCFKHTRVGVETVEGPTLRGCMICGEMLKDTTHEEENKTTR